MYSISFIIATRILLILFNQILKLLIFVIQETAKDDEGEDDDKDRSLPNWVESDDMPPPKVGKKRGPKKGQAGERKTAKRKQGSYQNCPPLV